MLSQTFKSRDFLWDKYRRMEDQKLGPMLVRNQDFAEGEELGTKN